MLHQHPDTIFSRRLITYAWTTQGQSRDTVLHVCGWPGCQVVWTPPNHNVHQEGWVPLAMAMSLHGYVLHVPPENRRMLSRAEQQTLKFAHDRAWRFPAWLRALQTAAAIAIFITPPLCWVVYGMR